MAWGCWGTPSTNPTQIESRSQIDESVTLTGVAMFAMTLLTIGFTSKHPTALPLP